jgi:hypothetical protein
MSLEYFDSDSVRRVSLQVVVQHLINRQDYWVKVVGCGETSSVVSVSSTRHISHTRLMQFPRVNPITRFQTPKKLGCHCALAGCAVSRRPSSIPLSLPGTMTFPPHCRNTIDFVKTHSAHVSDLRDYMPAAMKFPGERDVLVTT